MSTKQLLILQASDDVRCAEMMTLSSQADLFGIEVIMRKVDTPKDIAKVLFEGRKYDYIYLCAHADECGFGNKDRSLAISWRELGHLICISDCVNHEAVFMLACCRSGYEQVAFALFHSCNRVQYVFGPRSSVDGATLVAGSHSFFYNVAHRREQPNRAAKRASKSTGYDFLCYDIIETKLQSQFLAFVEREDDAYERNGVSISTAVHRKFKLSEIEGADEDFIPSTSLHAHAS